MVYTNRLGDLDSKKAKFAFDMKTLEAMSWEAVELVNEKMTDTDNYLIPMQLYASGEIRAFEKNDMYLRACYVESNMPRKVFKIANVVKGKAIPMRDTRRSKESTKYMHVFVGATLVNGKPTDFVMVDFFEISREEYVNGEFVGHFRFKQEIMEYFLDTKEPLLYDHSPSDIDD